MRFSKTYERGKKWLKNLGYASLAAGMIASTAPAQNTMANTQQEIPNSEPQKMESIDNFEVDITTKGEVDRVDKEPERIEVDNRNNGTSHVRIYPVSEGDLSEYEKIKNEENPIKEFELPTKIFDLGLACPYNISEEVDGKSSAFFAGENGIMYGLTWDEEEDGFLMYKTELSEGYAGWD